MQVSLRGLGGEPQGGNLSSLWDPELPVSFYHPTRLHKVTELPCTLCGEMGLESGCRLSDAGCRPLISWERDCPVEVQEQTGRVTETLDVGPSPSLA